MSESWGLVWPEKKPFVKLNLALREAERKGGGRRGGQSQPVWHLGHSQSLSCPSLILLGQGGNNAPIDAHTPRDNISVSPGTGAKQVSLVGVGSLL